jgi:hypothetical protein
MGWNRRGYGHAYFVIHRRCEIYGEINNARTFAQFRVIDARSDKPD